MLTNKITEGSRLLNLFLILHLMIKSCSVKHKLQVFCPFLNFPAVLRICQETLGLFPSFLISQYFVDTSSLNEELC